MQRSTCVAAAQDKPPLSFPLLIKLAAYQSAMMCLLVSSVLCVGGPVSDFIQEALQVVKRKFMDLISLVSGNSYSDMTSRTLNHIIP